MHLDVLIAMIRQPVRGVRMGQCDLNELAQALTQQTFRCFESSFNEYTYTHTVDRLL